MIPARLMRGVLRRVWMVDCVSSGCDSRTTINEKLRATEAQQELRDRGWDSLIRNGHKVWQCPKCAARSRA